MTQSPVIQMFAILAALLLGTSGVLAQTQPAPTRISRLPKPLAKQSNPFASQFSRAYQGLDASKKTATTANSVHSGIRTTSGNLAAPNVLPRPTADPTPARGLNAGRDPVKSIPRNLILPIAQQPSSHPQGATTFTQTPAIDFFSDRNEIIEKTPQQRQVAPPANRSVIPPMTSPGTLPRQSVSLNSFDASSPSNLQPQFFATGARLSNESPGFLADTQANSNQMLQPNRVTPELAPDGIAWWKGLVQNPLRQNSTPLRVETNALVYSALKRSPRIRALSQNPLIRETQVAEAEAEFDPVSFLRTQFQDRVDPVGDNLSTTNDGTNFLDDHIWTGEGGVRKKLQTGGSYEFSQTLGFRNSNSAFFNPQDQGTATLALNVTQPLLKGRGLYYNRSQILIAQKSTGVAWNTFQGELQNEIQKTVEAYWRLYYDRCVYLQKQRNVERAESILATLQGRAELDSLPSQVARARSAVLSRKTDLANARRDIRNSETELRRLTADSDWKAGQRVEMLPGDLPVLDGPSYELSQVITTALENRTEIKETLQRVRIAAVQRDISTNDLLPELSLLMGTYVSTLQGDSQIGDAFVDQFAGGGVKPGYSVGLEFEVPIGNRAARSRLTQRKLQLTKIKAEVDETMQNVIAEAQISLRRVESAKQTLAAATEAIIAAQMDLNQNIGRWQSFALIEGDIAEGQTPTTVLDQLLDSQERLTAAELVYAQAELELKTAETALARTMGTMLMQRKVTIGRTEVDGQPEVDLGQQ